MSSRLSRSTRWEMGIGSLATCLDDRSNPPPTHYDYGPGEVVARFYIIAGEVVTTGPDGYEKPVANDGSSPVDKRTGSEERTP